MRWIVGLLVAAAYFTLLPLAANAILFSNQGAVLISLITNSANTTILTNSAGTVLLTWP